MEKSDFDLRLLQCENDDEILDFSRKYILHGIPYIFRDREDEYFEFRNRISKHFKIDYYQVNIVGSAKLGFSFRKGTEFSYESDIDVAVVNETLFDKYLKYIREFQYNLDRSTERMDTNEYKRYNRFLRYIAKGWMRPDLLPNQIGDTDIKAEWFDFFNGISYDKSEVGNYKVNAGVYKSYDYLEYYNIIGLKDYLDVLRMEEIENE